MKIANIAREIIYNFWTTWVISMKFSGKMCLIIILKVTKNQGFILYLEDTFFEKPQVESIWSPPSCFRVKNDVGCQFNPPFGFVEKYVLQGEGQTLVLCDF